MQKTDRRVQSNGLQSRFHFIAEQSICKRQQRIDRVHRRASAAPGKPESGFFIPDESVKNGKITFRRTALHSSQQLKIPFVSVCKLPHQRFQIRCGILNHLIFRRRMIAQETQEHLFAVCQLRKQNIACHSGGTHRRISRTELFATQQDITGNRSLHTCEETSVLPVKRDKDIIFGTEMHQIRRDQNPPENDNRAQIMQRQTHDRSLVPINRNRLSLFPQIRSLRGDKQSIQ